MIRDFTYVEDLAESIIKLLDVVPTQTGSVAKNVSCDSISPVAPYRVVNIGNSRAPTQLIEFISYLELALGKKAKKNLLPMQPGDVPMTAASTDLLFELTGYRPNTDLKFGVGEFVAWYLDYYGHK